jgi:hypothetical protein
MAEGSYVLRPNDGEVATGVAHHIATAQLPQCIAGLRVAIVRVVAYRACIRVSTTPCASPLRPSSPALIAPR